MENNNDAAERRDRKTQQSVRVDELRKKKYMLLPHKFTFTTRWWKTMLFHVLSSTSLFFFHVFYIIFDNLHGDGSRLSPPRCCCLTVEFPRQAGLCSLARAGSGSSYEITETGNFSVCDCCCFHVPSSHFTVEIIAWYDEEDGGKTFSFSAGGRRKKNITTTREMRNNIRSWRASQHNAHVAAVTSCHLQNSLRVSQRAVKLF